MSDEAGGLRLTLDDEGFTIADAAGGRHQARWADVQVIAAYKRDLGVTDAICVAFELAGPTVVEVTEEDAGFEALFGALERHFGVGASWYIEIMEPAFEATPRVLYQRPDAAP